MKVLIIARSKWRRGGAVDDKAGVNKDGLGLTYLLNSQGYMCCLGFDALACGLSTEQILNRTCPDSLTLDGIPDEYLNRTEHESPSHPVRRAIEINDACNLSDQEREAQLIPILKELGWDDVVFVN
jgi:hypothetical protein